MKISKISCALKVALAFLITQTPVEGQEERGKTPAVDVADPTIDITLVADLEKYGFSFTGDEDVLQGWLDKNPGFIQVTSTGKSRNRILSEDDTRTWKEVREAGLDEEIVKEEELDRNNERSLRSLQTTFTPGCLTNQCFNYFNSGTNPGVKLQLRDSFTGNCWVWTCASGCCDREWKCNQDNGCKFSCDGYTIGFNWSLLPLWIQDRFCCMIAGDAPSTSWPYTCTMRKLCGSDP
jgi:hypothetical protein